MSTHSRVNYCASPKRAIVFRLTTQNCQIMNTFATQPSAINSGSRSTALHHHRAARQGFTLVEIMIVVVIIGLLSSMAIPAFAKVRTQSRLKTVTNNLRILASASQQFMGEKGTTQAAYTDLVGTGTDYYVRSVATVAGENYTAVSVAQTATQISISSSAFGTVTYNM